MKGAIIFLLMVLTSFGQAFSGFGDGGFVWGKGYGTLSNQPDLQAALNLKANLASPTFTGTVTLPSGQALIAPALGTPASGTLTNCTFPTLNQNTTDSAATLTTSRTINGVAFNGSAPITVTAAGSTLSDPVTFANGANTGSAATSATTGTITVNMTTSIVTCTPTGAMTLNFNGGVTGQVSTFIFTTSGASSFIITFGANSKSQGTLATGTTTAKVFTVSFRCKDGTTWCETGRTTAM